MSRLEAYCAGIISSQKAAALVAGAITSIATSDTASGFGIPFLTVGSRSKETLAAAGVTVSCSAPSGSALKSSLEEHAPAWRSSGKPVIFFCADRRLDVIPDTLAACGVPFEEVHLYSTRAAAPEAIDAGIATALIGSNTAGSEGTKVAAAASDDCGSSAAGGAGASDLSSTAPDTAMAMAPATTVILVFFSPSGVKAVAESAEGRRLLGRARRVHDEAASQAGGGVAAAQAAGHDAHAHAHEEAHVDGDGDGGCSPRVDVIVVAFGSTTATSLMDEAGVQVAAVCPSPDPAGLVHALQTVSPR